MPTVSETEQEPQVEAEAVAETPSPEARQEALEARLAALTAPELGALIEQAEERDKFFDRMQRLQSEMENIQKRARRERDNWLLQANQNLLSDVLPVVDSFELALQNAGDDAEGFSEGMRNIQQQLQAILDRHGVVTIDALGKPFDPAVHEALMTQESGDHPAETVLLVLKQGYRLHDRVLRPAQVSVSSRPAESD